MTSKPIDQADIQEYLATQSDFDLELFVYRSVQQHGMTALHGGSYIDPTTGKTRQFDVRAYHMAWPHCAVFLAIECKSLAKTFPLIVSRVPRPHEDAYHELLKSWGRKEQGEHFQTKIRFNERLPLYPAGQMVGKKTAQIKRDIDPKKPITASDAETFEKWSQALASANDFIAHAALLRGDDGQSEAFSAVLPVLVVSDETLWVVDYSNAGVIAPQQADETTLFVGQSYKISQRAEQYTISHLHIYTRTGFTKFLNDLRSPAQNGLKERLFHEALR